MSPAYPRSLGWDHMVADQGVVGDSFVLDSRKDSRLVRRAVHLKIQTVVSGTRYLGRRMTEVHMTGRSDGRVHRGFHRAPAEPPPVCCSRCRVGTYRVWETRPESVPAVHTRHASVLRKSMGQDLEM